MGQSAYFLLLIPAVASIFVNIVAYLKNKRSDIGEGTNKLNSTVFFLAIATFILFELAILFGELVFMGALLFTSIVINTFSLILLIGNLIWPPKSSNKCLKKMYLVFAVFALLTLWVFYNLLSAFFSFDMGLDIPNVDINNNVGVRNRITGKCGLHNFDNIPFWLKIDNRCGGYSSTDFKHLHVN